MKTSGGNLKFESEFERKTEKKTKIKFFLLKIYI